MNKINRGDQNQIPQAAIDAAYRLMDRVEASRKRKLAMEQLGKNTSVNMSPYKEAIQNDDTPKKKAAEKKVDELFNK